MKRSCVILAILASVLSHAFQPVQSARADEADRRLVTAEVSGALARLEQAFAQISGTGTVKQFAAAVRRDASGRVSVDSSAQPTLIRDSNVEFQIQGKLKSVQIKQNLGSITPSRRPEELVYCAGAEVPFCLQKDGPGSEFVVKGAGREQGPASETAIHDQLEFALYAPFKIYNSSLKKFMDDPNFKITEVSSINGNNSKFYKMAFECHPKNLPIRSGWVVFSPANQWAIVECHLAADDPRAGDLAKDYLSTTIEYTDSGSGVPVPRRVTQSVMGGLHLRILELRDVSFEPIPKEKFTLAAYGFPELGDPARRPSVNRVTYWLVGIALVALAITVAMRYGAARSQRA